MKMKKSALMIALTAAFTITGAGSLVASADADHPGTMGYQAQKEAKEDNQTPQKNNLFKLNLNLSANNGPQTYDLSEFQENISNKQAEALKREVPFVILRAQYGSVHKDNVISHNTKMMEKHGIPYGVYSYSMYTSQADAQNEARTLYKRAPRAQFYINDYEENHAKHSHLAAEDWASQMKALAGGRKVLLYSGSYFMKQHTSKTVRNAYDGLWEASYGGTPWFNPVLHQYTDSHYTPALGKKVDASYILTGVNWFTANNWQPAAPSQPSQPAKPKSQYYKASYVKKVRIIAKKGIYTYSKKNKRLNKVRYGKVLKTSGYTKKFSKSNKFMHAGHSTHFTANKKYVKWVK